MHKRLNYFRCTNGLLMSSSLRATGWRPSAADWGGSMSVVLRRGSTCPLPRAVDGCIPRHGIISSCQSAATSRIVKRCCSCYPPVSSAISSIQALFLVTSNPSWRQAAISDDFEWPSPQGGLFDPLIARIALSSSR